MNQGSSSWTARVLAAAGTVLVVAVVGRLAWEMLFPLVGPLLAVTVVSGVVLWIRRRRW